MGNLKPIDSALVKDVDYDLISPDTVGGEYIETIGAACENPDGYTSGSLFLGRENGVQHLYRATAAIALGETIILDNNCVYTTVSGELEGKAAEISSLNEALTNEVATRVANGAHNLLPISASTQVVNGITFTVNADGTVTVSGNATGYAYLDLTSDYIELGDYTISGCPSGGSASTYYLAIRMTQNSTWYRQGVETGNGYTITPTDKANANRMILRIKVEPGTNISSPIVFKPMIRLTSDPSSEYTPYAKTNRELTEESLWVAVNALKNITNDSGNGANLTFYKKGKTLRVFGHIEVSDISENVVFTLKDEYSIINETFLVMNYNSITDPTQQYQCFLTAWPAYCIIDSSGITKNYIRIDHDFMLR